MTTRSYPWLQNVPDQATRDALRLLLDKLANLEGDGNAKGIFRSNSDYSGFRATNLGDPTEERDAIPLSYAEEHYGPEMAQTELAAEGAFPLDVTGLPGELREPQRPRVQFIPAGDPLPKVTGADPYEMVLNGNDGYLYWFDPRVPPGVWRAITPGPIPGGGVGGGGGGGGGGTCGGASNSPNCPRLCSGGVYATAVDLAQTSAENTNPGLFEPATSPLTIIDGNQNQYRSAVLAELNSGIYNVIASPDPSIGQEIQVKDADPNPTFSEHYAIYASNRQVRRNPGSYRATCTPAQF